MTMTSRAANVPTRAIWALTLAILLALRLLFPPGFMPSFDHGAVTIRICPDAEPGSGGIDHHHGGHSKTLHQPCAYASGSAFGAAFGEAPLFAALLAAAIAPNLARPSPFAGLHSEHERPPLRGPPIPA
jgi:hypothetical protein